MAMMNISGYSKWEVKVKGRKMEGKGVYVVSGSEVEAKDCVVRVYGNLINPDAITLRPVPFSEAAERHFKE
jgi:hypothetical protein